MVSSCAPLPWASSLASNTSFRTQNVLVCSWDSASQDAAYVVEIDSSGARGPGVYPQVSPVRESAGLFYDIPKNLLYWTLHVGTPGGPPYVVKQFKPSVEYRIVGPPEMLFDYPRPEFPDYGITFQSAGIDPFDQSVYLYIPVNDEVAIGGVAQTVTFFRLHRWDPNRASLPVAVSDSVTESGILNLQLNIPRFFVTTLGRWYVQLESANSIISTLQCQRCPDGFTSSGGQAQLGDCFCAGNTWFNSTLGGCQPHRTECPEGDGYFISTPGTPYSDLICSPCQSCGDMRFIGAGCTKDGTQDTILHECRDCAGCGIGNYVSDPTKCSGRTLYDDSSEGCSPCATCLDLQFITGQCTGKTRLDTHLCADCERNPFSNAICPVGEYNALTGGCDGTGYADLRNCQSCTGCEAGQAIVANACDGNGRSDDQQCGNCDSCGEGQFRASGCLATDSNYQCLDCQGDESHPPKGNRRPFHPSSPVLSQTFRQGVAFCLPEIHI